MENKTVLTANEKVEQYDAMDQRPLSRNTVTINVSILKISIKKLQRKCLVQITTLYFIIFITIEKRN